jgi:hypothetical protein
VTLQNAAGQNTGFYEIYSAVNGVVTDNGAVEILGLGTQANGGQVLDISALALSGSLGSITNNSTTAATSALGGYGAALAPTPTPTPTPTPGGTPTPTPTPSGTTVAVKAAGTVDASAGNVTITFASGNYTETVTGFKATDKLVGFTGDTLSIVNASGTDGNITINMNDAPTGNQVVIQLTGIPAAIDATIFNVASFITAFGAGSLV